MRRRGKCESKENDWKQSWIVRARTWASGC